MQNTIARLSIKLFGVCLFIQLNINSLQSKTD